MSAIAIGRAMRAFFYRRLSFQARTARPSESKVHGIARCCRRPLKPAYIRDFNSRLNFHTIGEKNAMAQ